MRAEILVHNSRNWDFTKIPNDRRRERVKKASISMPLLFPDKHINQTNLSRKYSGVMGIFTTHPCLQWVWRKKQEHGGETSEEYWFVVRAGLRKGTKGERFPHSISSPGGTQV